MRTELLRPGQSLIELADRVKLMVRAIAQDFSAQQEPEITENAPEAYDVMLIGSIGRERFRMSQDKCAGDLADWNQIKALKKRELYERHRRRFDGCATAEAARREIAQLALTSDDPIEPPPVAPGRKPALGDLGEWMLPWPLGLPIPGPGLPPYMFLPPVSPPWRGRARSSSQRP